MGFLTLQSLIILDHWTDDWVKVVHEFAKSHPYLNIKCFSKPEPEECLCTQEISVSQEKAEGDVVQWLDADELLGKQKLSRYVNWNCSEDIQTISSVVDGNDLWTAPSLRNIQ